MHYTLDYLESLPTLATGQTDDLKIEDDNTRVWLARTTVDDGEPYNNRVSIEKYIDGHWVTVEEYPAE